MDYQKQIERGFLEGEIDPFDFLLAEQLGMTLEQMRDTISNAEYLQWRAYFVWRNAQEEMALKGVQRS